MIQNLRTLHQIDLHKINNPNLFITGTVEKVRPDDSPITPMEVANKMVDKLFAGFSKSYGKDEVILEPCAGRGGILSAIMERKITSKVIFNEYDILKKTDLKMSYPLFEAMDKNRDSLYRDCGGSVSIYNHSNITKVIMNPPFNLAHEFLQAAFTWIPPGGQIVTLFPKFSLAKLNTQPDTFLRLVSAKSFSIEDISFGCGYDVKISLINIIK